MAWGVSTLDGETGQAKGFQNAVCGVRNLWSAEGPARNWRWPPLYMPLSSSAINCNVRDLTASTGGDRPVAGAGGFKAASGNP